MNILSADDISFILSLPDVISNKAKIEANSSNNIINFNIALPDYIKKILQKRLGLQLLKVTEIPMCWISGNDIIFGMDNSDNLNTYLIYVTVSSGELKIGDSHFSLQSNSAYVFNRDCSYMTINADIAPRLIMGPMSENMIPAEVINSIEPDVSGILDPSGILDSSDILDNNGILAPNGWTNIYWPPK